MESNKTFYFAQNWKIFLAMFIDFIAVNLFALIFINAYAAIFRNILDRYTLGYIGFGLYIFCLLLIPILSALAQTPGQFLTKTRIVSQAGNKLNIFTAIARWFCSIISLSGYNLKNVPWYDRQFSARMVKDN